VFLSLLFDLAKSVTTSSLKSSKPLQDYKKKVILYLSFALIDVFQKISNDLIFHVQI
jgi:hypothetical protein